MAAVPEQLREAVEGLQGEERAAALAFFGKRPGYSGTREIVLQTETAAGGEAKQILLRFDFESAAWKRIRRKVQPPPQPGA